MLSGGPYEELAVFVPCESSTRRRSQRAKTKVHLPTPVLNARMLRLRDKQLLR